MNSSLALGNGSDDTTAVAWTPKPVLTSVESSVDPLGHVTAVASRMYTTCAILEDKKVRCWGSGFWGQLGNQDPPHEDSSLAVPVEGVEAEAVAAGDTQSCALDAAGAIVCWGTGITGGLGDGKDQDSLLPVAVLLPNPGRATALACGPYHSCAILDNADQTAVCWGFNDYGQVGAGIGADWNSTPVPVTDLSHVTAISASRYRTCAVVATPDNPGAVYCWGDDTSEQKGPPVLAQGF
jgi:alpha-tubulin suppressor-like RCC1 family protein